MSFHMALTAFPLFPCFNVSKYPYGDGNNSINKPQKTFTLNSVGILEQNV